MPQYIASGSHYFRNAKYRFLILPRFKYDLHSIIKDKCVDLKNVLIIGCQVLDVLEYIHDKGYAHSDIKAENMMIDSCTYKKRVESEPQPVSVNSDDDDYDDASSDSRFPSPPRYKSSQKKFAIQFSGSNPVRSCRMSRKNSIYQDMLNSHYLRPSKKVKYWVSDDENDDDNDDDNDEEEADKLLNKRFSRKRTPVEYTSTSSCSSNYEEVQEDRIFLIDFGLASKFIDSSGNHRPFCMDQRRAHDGTLEFTSRDAHMGAHSRRSDLECFGYNLMFWYQGSLPWKDDKLMTQPEQVHRMKEYFMTDVRKVFKDVYGQNIPRFLGDFLEYVGKLAYHDRPDYDHCRNIFTDELRKLGCKLTDMKLNINELKKKPARKSKNNAENNNMKLKDVKELLKLGMIEQPFRESGTPRISPKNLRSKSDKIPKKQRKKFSWTDILSTDPDQIARQRAEKEFARDTTDTPVLARYKGKPTYAILEIENRIKFRDKLDSKDEWDTDNIKGYTKPMMDILRKKQLMLMSQFEKKKPASAIDVRSAQDSTPLRTVLPNIGTRRERMQPRKSGLRSYIRPTEKNISYRQSVSSKKHRNGNSEFTPTDESSCGSATTDDSSKTIKSSRRYNSSSYATSSGITSDDEDSRDTTDYYPTARRQRSTITRKTKYLNKKFQNGRGKFD